MGDGVKLLKGDIAQGGLLEEARAGFALFTTGVVLAADEIRLKLLLMITTATPFGIETALVPSERQSISSAWSFCPALKSADP